MSTNDLRPASFGIIFVSMPPTSESCSTEKEELPVEAIQRVSAYHRRDHDLAVISFHDHELAAAKSSLLSCFGTSTCAVSTLENLPIELINVICLELDVASLFTLRHVNRRTRNIVNSLREYKLMATHATTCLAAMLRTNSARGITLCDLYRTFCQDTCSICREGFGNLLHLLTWTRCCSRCVRQQKAELAVVTVTDAKRVFKMSAASTRSLHTLKTLPGHYTMRETTYRRRLHLTSYQNLLSLHHIGNEDAVTLKSQPQVAFMSCCAFPHYDPTTRGVQNGLSCAGCQLAVEEADDSTDAMFRRRDMVFSETTFKAHIKECEESRKLWESSNRGAIEPVDLPQFCKEGGYFSTTT